MINTYPIIRDYSFDKVIYELIKTLDQKECNIPNLKIDIDFFGPDNNFCYIKKIKNDKFELIFNRVKKTGLLSDQIAIEQITIPKKKIRLSNEFLITYAEYTGNNWEEDKDKPLYANQTLFEIFEGSTIPDACPHINNHNNNQIKPFLISIKGNTIIDFIKIALKKQERPFIKTLKTEEILTTITQYLENKLNEIQNYK